MTEPVRVLVVDDDALICRALRRTFMTRAYEVVTADGVETAKAEIQNGAPFQVVLCDLTLKDGSGAVLVDWMEQAHPALWARTLVMTGGAMDAVGRKLVDSGRVEIVMKPFDLMALLDRVGVVAARAV